MSSFRWSLINLLVSQISMDQFCALFRTDKTKIRPIKRILVANNGIAAVKCIRSIRQWTYEQFSEDTVELIVMASKDDLEMNAEFIKLADRYVKVPGGRNVDNYANVNLITEIAKAQNCCAVWPGWGHASENPLLPERLEKENILFIGPQASAMKALGDKIGSMILAQSAGVPCIPWNGQGIKVSNLEEIESVYDQASIKNLEECQLWCDKIGYPVMIKASEGGGGKGIRKVSASKFVKDMYFQVLSEVPTSPIFIMKTATEVRHVEVQLLSDCYNDSISIFGRDCSVQRRHQKIIEEAPPLVVPNDIMIKMQDCAVKLARMVSYRSTGTVEYLFDPNSNEFYFLELNPRLQVEHPCSEMISGMNLPACQLQVAMGIPLLKISDVVKYLCTKNQEIDLYDLKNYPQPSCHVIAARITAENPEKGFLPSSGSMSQLSFRSRSNVWGYFSVDSNGGLHEYADSQFGHIFSQGSTRDEARKNLIVALRELSIQSEFRTSVAYLVKLMETETFVKNKYNTEWLDELLKSQTLKTYDDEIGAILYGSAFYFYNKNKNRDSHLVQELSRGIIPNISFFKRHSAFQFILNSIGYKVHGYECDSGVIKLVINSSSIIVECMELSDGGLLVSDGCNSITVFGRDLVDTVEISFKNLTFSLEKKFDRENIKCPGSGKINKWCISDGDFVEENDILCYVEVMKMISPIYANMKGNVKIIATEGMTVTASQTIAKYLNKDSDSKIPFFTGTIPKYIRPGSPTGTITVLYKNSTQHIKNVLNSFYPEMDIGLTCSIFLSLFQSRDLPFYLIREELLMVENRLDKNVFKAVTDILNSSERNLVEFPATQLLEILDVEDVDSIKRLVRKFENGLASYEMDVLGDIFHDFCTDVSFFAGLNSNNDILEKLKTQYPQDYVKWSSILWKQFCIQYRKELILSLLDLLRKEKSISILNKHFIQEIKELAYSSLPNLKAITIKAKELLLYCQIPSYSQKRQRLRQFLNDAIYYTRPWEKIVELSNVSFSLFDVLIEFCFSESSQIREFCMQCYILRAYGNNNMSMSFSLDKGKSFLLWKQSLSGGMFVVESLEDFTINSTIDVDLAYVVLRDYEEQPFDDSNWSAKLLKVIQEFQISRVTFILYRPLVYPKYFNFYLDNNIYKEDIYTRNIEPGLVNDLELSRFENFKIDPIGFSDTKFQVYHGIAKSNLADERIFLRCLVRPSGERPDISTHEYLINHGHKLMSSILDVIEIACQKYPKCDANHIFVKFVPVFVLEPEEVEQELVKFIMNYGDRLWKLKIQQAEILFTVQSNKFNNFKSFRFFASSEDGLSLHMESYVESVNNQGEKVFQSWNASAKSKVDESVLKPYLPKSVDQSSRSKASTMNTTFIQDIPKLMKKAIDSLWTFDSEVKNFMFTCLNVENEKVFESDNFSANHGMVAWKFFYTSPEAPYGRSIVVLANDITKFNGSFSVDEDIYFFQISQYCRQQGLPRVYFSANSGARVGIMSQILPFLKARYEKNIFSYFYIDSCDLDNISKSDIELEKVGDHFKVLSVLGNEQIGVENLSGSGLIAGETAKCYENCFTLSIVSCRTVGIGAYLVRLGSRVIQKKDSCILLTGKDALNKLLQKQVYNSNLQLGGPEIMYQNGISHLLVDSDQEAFDEALKWLQFIPLRQSELPPILLTEDSNRLSLVDFSSDIDKCIFSKNAEGFFDKNSFVETCGGWAKTIISGRARLLGFPVGVISLSQKVGTSFIPADPALQNSSETQINQAPFVWYPDGAYKTAEAIKDFNREGLPLMILANWRGFSGGQTDMYNMVLKFGAMIVEQLNIYKQPIIIYILPNAELRGGSWVVLDSKINPSQITLFADCKSRGNILEPEGLTSIKLRKDKQLMIYRTMFDPAATEIPKDKESEILKVSEKFAELHDTPTRMKHVKVIKDIIQWSNSRTYLGKFLEKEMKKEGYFRYYQKLYHKFKLPCVLNKEELNSKLENPMDKNKSEEWIYDHFKEELRLKVQFLNEAQKSL
eukprot:NODE_22_length_42145_cov_1.310612.p1 type:complete len:2002 gc:universal NODE_22_length_42145_cov_1.310612:25236-19231(-)